MFVNNIMIALIDGLKYKSDNLINKEIEILKNEGVEFQKDESTISTYGFSIKNQDKGIIIDIDPDLTVITFPIVEKILNSIRNNGVIGITLHIYFINEVRLIRELHKITTRLYNTDIKIDEKDGLLKGCVKFDIESSLQVECKCKTFVEMKLDELLNLLFERGILYLEE